MNHAHIEALLGQLPRGTTIIHGGARGADQMAGAIAGAMGFHVEEFTADWKNLGRSAGFQRNILMLEQKPDLVLAFQLNGSTGTQHTIDQARKRGIKVEVYS